ncbi:MAG: hypothetical protein HXY49_03575 [Ignavibacteriaceae bacterium]|nr:hypothetical protein [Ignavibacteriaceae bacterium]
MSWIFGYNGIITETIQKKFDKFDTLPEKKILNERLILLAGGNHKTLFYSDSKNWIVSGVGIIADDSQIRLMSRDDWDKSFANRLLPELEGHFLFIYWNDEEIIFQSDQAGLRTIYFYQTETGIFFSTKLKLLSSLLPKTELDFYTFGSRWKLFNQFSHDSIIKDVKKLPPAGIAQIKNNKLYLKQNKVSSVISTKSPADLLQVIEKHLKIIIPDELNLTLGLSGGLDSRFLFALMLKSKRDFLIHTFGSETDPDVLIAKRAAGVIRKNINFIQTSESISSDFLSKLLEYASVNELIEPVSSFQKLIVFENEYFRDKVIVDGALAEFARRQFLNRLLFKGKKLLMNKDSEGVISHLTLAKPEIFRKEYVLQMQEGIKQQLSDIFASHNNFIEYQPEQFLDQLIYDYRIPNYFGPEQSRLDEIVLSFMIFAQKNIFEICKHIPLQSKVNSRIFYNYLRENYPMLAKIPLIKGGISYQFGSSTIRSFIVTKLKKYFSNDFSSGARIIFLNGLKEYCYEILSEREIKNYPPYDSDKIIKIRDGFYEGNLKLANDLDWLLSFELFRKGLKID